MKDKDDEGRDQHVMNAWRRGTLVIGALIALLAGNAVTLSAQERGKRVYRETCARCHGPTLQGGVHAPTLTGTSFTSVWGSRSDDELFEYIRGEMPPGQGGMLRDAGGPRDRGADPVR